MAWTISVLAVHLALRVLVLGRLDAFGHEFVGRFHWYIFHAASFDARWIVLGSIPFWAHARFWESRAPRWAATALWTLVGLHGVLLMATVADHELQRFLGSHLTPSVFETYGNPSALRELPNFFANDKSVPYLPGILFFGAAPAAWFLWAFLERRRIVVRRPGRWIVGTLAFTAAGWIFTELAWGGGNRERKLAPVLQVWWKALHAGADQGIPDSVYQDLSRNWTDSWLREAGSDTAWRFPDPSRPFWRVPASDSGIVAGSRRTNIVLIVVESMRALDVGALGPWGATGSSTPFVDSVSREGRLWTRHTCPSMPTVRALMSIHLGVWDHPDRTIATSFPGLAHTSLPDILGDHGWTTRFFSSADPAWDNQTPWLGRWYQRFDYSPSRERDADMFAHASRWMRDSLERDVPFFVTFMTKSNHYPFDQNREWTREKELRKRLGLSMAYTDSSIGAFVKSLRDEPWFSNTVFVVTGDHGFPLGEHGPGNMGHGLFTESVWLPLVAWGAHPDLAPGVSGTPSSHLDIAPTLLRLAGVRAPNHFAGHDLLDPSRSDSVLVVQSHYDEVAGTRGVWKAHGTLAGTLREKGPQMFRLDVDPREERDSAAGREPLRDSLVAEARSRVLLLSESLRRNTLQPTLAKH